MLDTKMEYLYQISLPRTAVLLATLTRPMHFAFVTAFDIVSSNIHVHSSSIFFLAIVNSWVLYKHVNKKMEFTYREFFRELIESLGQAGGRHRKRRRTERASPTTATAAAATTTAAATAAAATAAAAAAATAAAAPSMTAPTSNVHMLETAVKRGRCVVCRNPNHCRRFCVGCSPNVDDLVYLHDECFASHHCVTDLLSRFASAIKKKNDIKTPSLSA